MGLEMKVYRDPKRYEAKAMFGLSWRQLGALAAGVPAAGGAYAALVWALMTYSGRTFEDATNWAMPVLVVLFLPFGVWGWHRPHGLKPEKWMPYVLDYYLHPKELCRGYAEKPVGHGPARGAPRAHRIAADARSNRRRAAAPSEHVPTHQGPRAGR